jgi:histidyl-tRNA synthetase
LRVFDCKVEEDRTLLEEAPSLLGTLCEDCERHFSEVRRWLEEFGVTYRVDGRLVRGLDYYRRTVFEVVCSGLGAQNAILGGGRYDGLVEELGGPALPGVGFAMGMERTAMLIPRQKVCRRRPTVAIVGLGREGWEEGIRMAQRFRASGLAALTPLGERPMGAQLKRADRMGASHAVFIGQQELAQGKFGFKALETGEQVTLTEEEILARMLQECRRSQKGWG